MGEERPLEDTRGVLLLFSARLQKLPLGGGRGGGDSPMTKPNKRFLCNECGDCGRIPPQRNLFAFPPLCFLSGCSLSHSSVSSPPPPPPRKQRNNIKFPFPLINGLFFPPSPLKGTNHSNKSPYSSFAIQLLGLARSWAAPIHFRSK